MENLKYCSPHQQEEKSFFFDHVHIHWNEQITLHQSPTWELSYIIKGSGMRTIGDRIEPFSSGEVILIPPDMRHGFSFNEHDYDKKGKIENITIIFGPELLEKYINNFPETQAYISEIGKINEALTFQGESLKSLQKMMADMVTQNDIQQLSSLLNIFYFIATAKETKIAGKFVKEQSGGMKIQDITRYIIHNYQNKITLDEVARHFGTNTTTFCSFFKKEKGKSFFTALNEYRIECSCLMLLETAMPIANISLAVGFHDIPYFNRTFKRIKSFTPLEYRRNNFSKISGLKSSV